MNEVVPTVFWFDGLSGAGKTTLSRAVAAELRARGIGCLVLDGDEMRQGLCKGLGFSADDRMENIRRASEVAKLACDQGLVVLAAFITPERRMRDAARAIIGSSRFSEIYVQCEFAVCAARDVKGLYRASSMGALPQFTGKDSPFEAPLEPALRVNTQVDPLEVTISTVVRHVSSAIGAQPPVAAG